MSIKVADCRHGQQMYFSTDVYFGPLLENYGEYSYGEMDLFRQAVQPGDTVVDAGANIGCHTVALAKLVGPTGVVLAFEPQRPIYYALCGTIALNELWQVHTFPHALGASRGTTKLLSVDYSKPNNYGGVMGGCVEGNEVPVIPLDDLDMPSLKFIKADVEGQETEVLLGARETIHRHRPILYVENDRQENSDRLIETILGFDYRVYLTTPSLHNPDNFFGCKEDLFPKVVSIMLFCLPGEAPVETAGMLPILRPEDMPKFGRFPI